VGIGRVRRTPARLVRGVMEGGSEGCVLDEEKLAGRAATCSVPRCRVEISVIVARERR
jgi:hypothetical protein